MLLLAGSCSCGVEIVHTVHPEKTHVRSAGHRCRVFEQDIHCRPSVDIVGPFPPVQSGNIYIMVVCDYFTRWVEAFAIPNQEAMHNYCVQAGGGVLPFLCTGTFAL